MYLYDCGERKIGNLALDAMQFAMEVHKDQKRKYTGAPYFEHLAEVAGMVSTIEMHSVAIATAWLHDCIEDCGVSHEFISKEFTPIIANSVLILSDLEEGNRKERKSLSRLRLSKADHWVQNIKVCDMISNTSSIVQHDPEFAKIYMEETYLLLDVLTKANWKLLEIARNQL